MGPPMSASFTYGVGRAMVDTEMTHHPHIPSQSADAVTRQAVERAKTLVATNPRGQASVAWAYEASHVGDLSVLALALLR